MSDMTSMRETRRSADNAQEALVAELLRIARCFARNAQRIEGLMRRSGGATQETWSFSVLYEDAVEQ